MDALALHPDIALPSKQVDCQDNELLHPREASKYIAWYQQFSTTPINDDIGLINAFYHASRDSNFAGFKTMPNRHRRLKLLVGNPRVQTITLDRVDLASTIASFVIATRQQTWRREGGKQSHRFTFDYSYRDQVEGHLRYVITSRWILQSIPGAIHLRYESLCDADFHDPALDAYFGRHIALLDPKPPTAAQNYVNNWGSFYAFINDYAERMEYQLKHAEQVQSADNAAGD